MVFSTRRVGSPYFKAHAETKGLLFHRVNPSGLQINAQWHANRVTSAVTWKPRSVNMSIGVAKVAESSNSRSSE